MQLYDRQTDYSDQWLLEAVKIAVRGNTQKRPLGKMTAGGLSKETTL